MNTFYIQFIISLASNVITSIRGGGGGRCFEFIDLGISLDNMSSLLQLFIMLGGVSECVWTLSSVACHQESVALLTSKLRLLDPVQLGDVELRLQVLATRLDKLNKMKGSAQEADKLNKVGEEGLCVLHVPHV